MPTRVRAIAVKQKPRYSTKTRSLSHIKDNGGQTKSQKNKQGTIKVQGLRGNGKKSDESLDMGDNVKIDQFISLRADLSLDTIIEDFTPEDFAELLIKLEEEFPRFHTKLTYLYEERKLLVMAPSSAHEDILGSFNDIVSSFIASISLARTFKLIVHMNKAVTYRKDGDEDECEGISDFQLIIRNTSLSAPRGLTSIPKWIGEVSFTASSSETRTHLKNLVTGNPNLDLAFLITIEEHPDWKSPIDTNINANTLCTQTYLDYDDFIRHVPASNFGHVVVGGVTWASIMKVTFEAYIRHPDGTLTIDPDGEENKYWACGTLYPTIQMNNIDSLLHDASDRLKASLVSVMEASQADPEAIHRVRQSTARLCPSWDDMMDNFRIGVRTTAHERYRRWHRAGKRKRRSVDAGSRKKKKKVGDSGQSSSSTQTKSRLG